MVCREEGKERYNQVQKKNEIDTHPPTGTTRRKKREV